MTKQSEEKSVEEHQKDCQKKLISGMNEILYVLKIEMEKVENTIQNVKNNPKPDINYLTLPERLKCYNDGIMYAHKLISKYKQLESLIDTNGK